MAIKPLPSAFEHFQRERKSDLQSIASATRGTHKVEDLISEAWLLACEIGEKRGRLDLFDRGDQVTLLKWLRNKVVTYVRHGRTESIDQELGEDGCTWHDRLPASADTEPLLRLIWIDETPSALPLRGFSEFSAYMILLDRFDWRAEKMATYLAVSFYTLRRRILNARDRAHHQPSLFDGVDDVDPDFMPRSSWIKRIYMQWQSSKMHWRLA